jgi:hypothetical protein
MLKLLLIIVRISTIILVTPAFAQQAAVLSIDALANSVVQVTPNDAFISSRSGLQVLSATRLIACRTLKLHSS